MNVRFFVVVLIFVPCGFLGGAFAQSPPDALKPLENFVGTWRKEFTIFESKWTPKTVAQTGTHTTEWVLDHQHLQESGKDSDGKSYISMISYGMASKDYRSSIFDSRGAASQWSGRWDESKKTMTWTTKVDADRTSVATYRFTSPDAFDLKVLIQDSKGEVYFRLEGKGNRIK